MENNPALLKKSFNPEQWREIRLVGYELIMAELGLKKMQHFNSERGADGSQGKCMSGWYTTYEGSDQKFWLVYKTPAYWAWSTIDSNRLSRGAYDSPSSVAKRGRRWIGLWLCLGGLSRRAPVCVCTPTPLDHTRPQFIDTRKRAAVPLRARVGFGSFVVGVDFEIILGEYTSRLPSEYVKLCPVKNTSSPTS